MDLQRLALIVHIFAAMGLVGSMVFNVFVLMPSLDGVAAAYAATISDKVGNKLKWIGPVTLVLLGVTGFIRLDAIGLLNELFTIDFYRTTYGHWMGLMFWSWLVLVGTGTLSLIWYERVLARKLSYDANIRDLEHRRQAQEKIARWQDRLNYVNVSLGILAALGGSLVRAG